MLQKSHLEMNLLFQMKSLVRVEKEVLYFEEAVSAEAGSEEGSL